MVDDNPYSPPEGQAESLRSKGGFGDANRAYELVSAPATALIGLTAAWLCVVVVGTALNFLILAGFTAREPDPQLAELGLPTWIQFASRLIWSAVILTTNGVILAAALRMRSLRSYGLCQLGAVLAAIPCVGPCYLLGIPFGIWALIALNRPGVRDAFTR